MVSVVQSGRQAELRADFASRCSESAPDSKIVDRCPLRSSSEPGIDERTNQKSVQLFRMAEKAAYLKEPEIQRKIMVLVGNSYLKDSNIIGNISRDEAIDHFEKHREQFSLPEVRIGRHILVSVGDAQTEKQALRKAAKILTEVSDVASFQEQAVQFSDDEPTKQRGGLMEPTSLDGMRLKIEPEVARALFTLKSRGSVYPEAVRSKSGLHIVQLAKVIRPPTTEFEHVEAMVRAEVRKERIRKLLEAQ